MSLKNWLETLRAPFRRTYQDRVSRRRASGSPGTIGRAEHLEVRALLTANLFVDFGDNFTAGVLATTQGAFRDVANDPIPGNRILGPQLEDSSGFNAGTALNIVAQSFSAAERAQMLATVIRAYQPLDVHVVELTTTPQMTIDGRWVTGASSMADVVNTLRGGDPTMKDAYVFAARFIADPGGVNEVVYGPSGGGTSPVDGLDTSDLTSGLNLHDDVAVVFTDTSFGFNFNTMNNIAHEAGHNFGLRHSLTNSSGNAATDLFHRSELMSYLNTNFTTSSLAFSRYPVIRGDGNSPGGSLVSYDDLEARNGALTPYDQMVNDPGIGARPGYAFVSGTGAHDVITLTRNGGNADVTVTAYADAGYTTAIPVPGTAGASYTYSYSIPLTMPILVYGGYSDDLIQINGDLGVPVNLDGMVGTDSLYVNTMGTGSAVWTPRATAPAGVDFTSPPGSAPIPDYGGVVSFATTTIEISNYEINSVISLTGFDSLRVEGTTGDDQWRLGPNASGVLQLTGSVGGVDLVPITLAAVDAIQVDGLAGSDLLTVDNTWGLVTLPIQYNGGAGSGADTLQVLAGAFSTIRSSFTNANDGNLLLDGSSIAYTGLEPVLLNVGSVSGIIFDLPAILNPDVIISDDGFGGDPNGNTANTSAIDASTFEFTEFTNPTAFLRVNGALGFSNVVTLAVLDAAWNAAAAVDLNGGLVADTFTIQSTPAGVTTVNAGDGDDQFILSGDGLGGTSLFRGEGGNDNFTLNIVSHIGATAVADPTVSVQIEGNGNPLANSANRDRLIINDQNSGFSRNLIYDYLETQGDLDLLPGVVGGGVFGPESTGLLSLHIRTMETLRYNSVGPANDVVTISGRHVDDDLTVALTPTIAGQTNAGTSAFVFLNGNPYIASPGAALPPDTLSGNLPGVAGGGTGTDLMIGGISPSSGLTMDGSGTSSTGNRVIVQALSEVSLSDPVAVTASLDVFSLGLGPGLLVPGAGAGNAFEAIAVNGSTTFDADMGLEPSGFNQVSARNILDGQLVSVNVVPTTLVNGTTSWSRPGLIINGGDETAARISGVADNFTARPHALFNIAVNGNQPVLGAISADGFPGGDQLTAFSPSAFSLWSDKQSVPNVSILADNNPFGIVSSSIERTRLFPGNGTLNLIGDQNQPGVDQPDMFRAIGLDIDPNGSTDAGVQEMVVTINGSGPILIEAVQKLNVYGFDLTGQDLNNPDPNAPDFPLGPGLANIDTLEVTPFADNAGGPGQNAPRGWGVQTLFNEGEPAGIDGDATDLLIVHTSVGTNHGLDVYGGGLVSEQISVNPSGPDHGEVRLTNAVDGSMVATISYLNNTDLVLVDDDGGLSDTDSLILMGTDPGQQVSGNDSFDVDFEATGTSAAPMVTVRDSATGTILYRVRSFTDPSGETGPFSSVTFDMLGGHDSMRIRSGLLEMAPTNGFGPGMSQLVINGGVGDDALTLEYTTSQQWRGGRVTYDGGAGADTLSFTDGMGEQIPFRSVIYTPGPVPGNGRIEHLPIGGTDPAVVDFLQLEPVFDFTTAATVIINADHADNAISYYTDYGVGTLGPILSGGSWLNDGVYLNVALTGGTGSGARADITVLGGTIVQATLVNDGVGYTLGDLLSVNPVSLGGGTGGFSISVTSWSGTVAIDNQEVLVFSRKNTLLINGRGGSDVISLNNPVIPAGLSGIIVDGGDPTGSDTVVLTGLAGSFDNFQVTPTGAGSGLLSSTTATIVPTLYFGTEHLQITGQSADGDQLNQLGTSSSDTFIYSPGITADSGTLDGQVQGASGFAFAPITFHGILGAITAGTGNGDVLVINGTAADDTFYVGATTPPASAPGTFTGVRVDTGAVLHAPVLPGGLSAADQVILRGLEGNDTFNVIFNPLPASGLLAGLRIEGGDSDSDSDTVTYAPAQSAVTTIDLANSTIQSTGANSLSIDGVEALNVLGSDGSTDQFFVSNFGAVTDVRTLTVAGGDLAGADDGDTLDVSLTSGSDAIEYIPRSASEALLRDGQGKLQLHVMSLQGQTGDLTLSGNGGIDQLNVIASSGHDRIVLARTGSNASVQVIADGNPTGGAAWLPVDFDITATPGNIDGLLISGSTGDDLLQIDNSGGLLSLIHGITFDGGMGVDALQLLGSTAVTSAVFMTSPVPGAGRLIHTLSGSPDQVQDVRFTALEPVIDQVVAASLTVNATAAANSISYTPGPNSGIVSVLNPGGLITGQVSVDAGEPIEFSGKSALILNGLAGSDQFSLNNPTTPASLLSITVDGGDPTIDRDAILISGTVGGDSILARVISANAAIITGAGPLPIRVTNAEQVELDGQGGSDTLTYQTPVGADDVHFAASGNWSSGMIQGTQASGNSLIPISFRDISTGLAPALSFQDLSGTPLDLLTFSGTNTDDRLQVTAAGQLLAQSSTGLPVAPFISTPGIRALTLQGLQGDDAILLPGNHPFQWISVEGGSPSVESDRLSVLGSGSGVSLDLGLSSVAESGFGQILWSGIELLHIDAANAVLQTLTTTGNDNTDVLPTTATGGTLKNNGLSPTVSFVNVRSLLVDQLSGDDVLKVQYTTGADTIAVNVPAGLIADGVRIATSFVRANTESVQVSGQEGSDVFNVTTDPAIPIRIDGGDPIGTTPGDLLNILSGGPGVVFEPGPENDEGGFLVGANRRVSFDHIEALGVIGSSVAVISGTGADDDITIIARDVSTHAGTDGVQDFTTQVNAWPEILWINTPVIIVNALAGDDDIVVRAPAPNDANWNVSAYISGGAPAAGPFSKGDRFVLETPQTTADSILYTPTSVDSGVIVIDEAGTGTYTPATDTRIQLGSTPAITWPQGIPIPDPGGIETFVYDGEGGNDRLTLFGDGSGFTTNDFFTQIPGLEPDEGVVVVNSLLGIHYTDLGLTGVLDVDGLNGTDTLSVQGTALNDAFLVAGGTGTIFQTLSSGESRVSVIPMNMERVILEGLSGDDLFQIAGNTPVAIRINGGEPSIGSDTIAYVATGATIVDLGNSTIDDDGVNPPADVTYTGIETILLNAAGFGLTVNGTSNDDVLTYVPQGPAAGRVQANGTAPVVNFSAVSSFGISALGASADMVIVQGTTNHDVITVDSPTRTVTVTNASGTILQPVVLSADVETARIEAGLGNDTIVVVPGLPVGPVTASPQSLPVNLLIDVDGGPPSASDALVIAGTVTGGTLPASDFVVHNKSRTPDSGRLRVFRNIQTAIVPLPDISYANVEVIAPLVTVNPNPAVGPQLLQQGPDLYEQNESWQSAAFAGSGDTITLKNLAIFPDLNEHPFVPGDLDFFRFTAKHSGTMDFHVVFNTWNGLLPGGGDLDIRVLDGNGTVIAGPGSAIINSLFGVANAANPTETPPVPAGNNADERLRIPVVAGQTYFLQVYSPTQTRFNTNAYNLTVTNTPAPIPYDIELSDALVNGAVSVGGLPVGLNTQFTVPAALLNPTPGFYVGKVVHFMTGGNAGLSLRLTAQAAGGVLSVATAGLRAPVLAGDGFRIEATDSGRSEYDNITRDNTPLLIFRLDDDLLQNDLPGNPAPAGPTPDQPTRIPWNNTFTAVAGPSVGVVPSGDPAMYLAGAVPGQTAGYRVAIYEEGTPTTAGGPGPNGLWGYATMIAPGVYQFNFGNSSTNNAFGPLALTNGSHFLTARVEMIDPAAVPGPANVQARGQRSLSLEVIVDAVPPIAAFGDLVSTTDGLHPSSDSSVSGVQATISDRITNDTTPTLYGTAEANAIVRAYLDVDASGTITGPDLLLGQSVATPLDGTSQAPFGQWILTSSLDLNSPEVLSALGSGRDGLRRLLISAEDVAGNMAVPAGLSTPQQLLSLFMDTQGPQIVDPDGGGSLQAIQIASATPLGPVNGINSFNLFATKPANATQGPTPLVNGLIIHVADLPARVLPFMYNAIQNPAVAGPIIAPLASVAPTAGAPAIAALAPIPIPAGAVALNPADFSVVGDANGNVTILSAWFVPTTPMAPQAVPASGYIVLTFRSATAGETLPDDRFTLTVSDKLTDPANNRLDGENQGISLPAGVLVTPTGDGQPGAAFIARFTVDSRPEAATFGQGGIFVDANGNWMFDPNNPDPANRDLTFSMGIDTDYVFYGRHSAAQTVAGRTSNGFDRFGAYGKLGGTFRWLLDTNDDGVADIISPQATGFTVSGLTFTGNGIPFTGNFVGAAGSADEIAIFDGINWFLDTAAPFNTITAADTAFAGSIRGLPIAGDFDGDGLTDLATHYASNNRFQFDYAATGGLTGAEDSQILYGFSGVLERPIAGDLNLDGITDIGLGVPNQDGVSTNTLLSWYVLQSTGVAAPGTNANLNHAFSPIPVGSDLFRQFGNRISIPMLGNFDPPPATATNAAPVVSGPQFVSTPESVLTTSITVTTEDTNGDQVTVSASADSMLWWLKSSLGLRSPANYNENWGGRGEKWIQDSAKRWYFITPSGALYRWDLRAVKLPAQPVTGVLIEILDPRVHANPALLTNAFQTAIPVTTSISGTTLTVTRDAGFQDPFVVKVHATDGVAATTKVVRLESATRAAVRLDTELGLSQRATNYSMNWGGLNEKWLAGSDKQWYFITPDGILRVWDRSKQARGEVVAHLDPAFHQNPGLLVNAAAISLDQTHGFKSTGSLAFNWGGKKEKWFQDSSNRWYFLLPNGEIRRWDNKAGANGELISLVDTSYYTNPVRVYKALDDVFSDWMELFN